MSCVDKLVHISVEFCMCILLVATVTVVVKATVVGKILITTNVETRSSATSRSNALSVTDTGEDLPHASLFM